MTTTLSHFLGIPCACLYDCGTLVEVKLGFTCKRAAKRLHK